MGWGGEGGGGEGMHNLSNRSPNGRYPFWGIAFYNGCVYKERLLAGILVAGKTKLAF